MARRSVLPPIARRGPTLLVLGLAGALAASGCGSDDPPAASAGTTASGGNLTFASEKEPDCFDPQVSQADITGVILRNVYESLVVQKPDGSYAPWLATKWKVSPDGRRYTFSLRDGVRFSDGTPFDAAAVKANFDRIADPKTKSKYAISLLGPYRDSRVLDPRTVEVRFKSRFATFLRSASTTYLGFHSTKSIEEHGSRLCAGSPVQVGTGPFLLRSYVRGQRLELVRNPRYDSAPATAGHRGPAHLDRLTFRFVPDPTVRVGSVVSHQVDVADVVPPNQIDQIARDATLKLVGTETPGVGYTYFLNSDNSLFRDRRLRLAVQQAFDVEAAVKAVYFGKYRRAWSVLSPATLGYDRALEGTWKHDPQAAGRLLDEAGYAKRDGDGYRTKDGKRLSTRLLYVPQYTSEDRAALDQALQADLKKAGIELKLVPLDAAAYEPVRNRGDYGLIAFAWGGADPDILRVLFDSSQLFDDGGNNAARLHDPQVDRWLRAAGATSDVGERKRLYALVQQKLIGDGDALPTGVIQRQIATRKTVTGLRFDANGWPLFYDVAKQG
ncbi:ABC transporter substrate-binding protein [Patulibacter defluvii]|uniref:ABC transporter substrate-binding protein n=1 Tax=Patulibacter defluvii TaxID=3095358 RepID=UPI002A74DBBC|nr:ABC transporter substrate-binding protein [Patulibacter sp. DM4]